VLGQKRADLKKKKTKGVGEVRIPPTFVEHILVAFEIIASVIQYFASKQDGGEKKNFTLKERRRDTPPSL